MPKGLLAGYNPGNMKGEAASTDVTGTVLVGSHILATPPLVNSAFNEPSLDEEMELADATEQASSMSLTFKPADVPEHWTR